MEQMFSKIASDNADVTGSKMRRMSLSNLPLEYPFEEDMHDPFASAHEELDTVKAWWRGRQNRWAARERQQSVACSSGLLLLPCLIDTSQSA
jgi:hypothetical protein